MMLREGTRIISREGWHIRDDSGTLLIEGDSGLDCRSDETGV